jgi:hypothetical protein
MPGVPLSRDPGLQPQRTGLSWERTALGALVVAMALVGLALHEQWSTAVVVALTCVSLAAMASVLVVPVSVRHLGRSAASPWVRLLSVVGATSLLAIGGAVTALVSAGAKP